MDLSEQVKEYETCLSCGSRLSFPVERIQLSDEEWRVTVQCPNCFRFRTECVHRDVMYELVKSKNRGTEELIKTLSQMTKRTMEEEAEKMISALHKDQIQPIDF